ncbi:MAG: hypothetical protein EBR82_29135 [Caulobacteraceae bacterium]|nr:hypothetical protein [Caulobacteraceae bacterium]
MPSPRKSAEEIQANKELANQKRKLRRLWSYSDLSFGEVCEEIGMDAASLIAYAKSIGLQDRVEPLVFIPTPEQIRVAAAEIRAGWTEAERECRLGAGVFARMNNATEPHNDDSRTASCDGRKRGQTFPENRRSRD